MAARIAIDPEAMRQHSKGLVCAADSIEWPLGMHIDVAIDQGAFGMMLSGVTPVVELVATALQQAITDAGDALARTSGTVLDVSSEFTAVEEAAATALDALHEQITPTGFWQEPWQQHRLTDDLHPDVPQHTQWITGLYLAEDIRQTADGISRGDWVDIGLGGAGTIMDSVALISDPLGSLIAMGLSWVIEHLNPLADWFEQLTGDPDRVAQYAATWRAVAGRMADVATDVRVANRWLDDLAGATVEAMQQFSRDLIARLDAVATATDAFATGLELLASAVASVHDLVRDLLSQLVGSIISYAIELAETELLAAPLVVEQIETRLAALVPRATRAIESLVRSADDFVRMLTRLTSNLDDLARTFRALMRDAPEASPGLAGSSAATAWMLPLSASRRAAFSGPLSKALPDIPPSYSMGWKRSAPPWVADGFSATGSGKGARFSNAKSLLRHFRKHAGEFGLTNLDEYARCADDFLTGPRDPDTVELVRDFGSAKRDHVLFNPRTWEFGIVSEDGAIKTYFIPDPASINEAHPDMEPITSGWEYFEMQAWDAPDYR